MAARAKGGGADWDDFNTTQYDDDCFSSDGVPVDHYKLYVTNLPIGLGESGLADLFGKYGKVATTYLSKDPSKRFAIIKFETPGEANIAMMKLNRTEPLKLYINFAHLKKPEKHSKTDRHTDRHHSNTDRQMVKHNERHRSGREDSSSVSSKGQKPRMIEYQINDDEVDDETEGSEEMDINRNLHYNLETLKLKQLELKEKQLECQQRILMIQQAEKLKTATASVSKRRILPNGRIVIQNGVDITQDNDTCYTAGVGDSRNIPRLQRSARCVACGGVAAAFCSGCGVTPYCGELCQKRDWIDRHRSVCHNLARLPDADEEDATSEPMIVSEPPRQSQNARGESQLPRNDIGSDRVPKKSFPFGLKNISTQKIPTKSSQEGNRGRGQNANKSQDWKIRQENQESGGNRNQESGGNRNQESGGNRSQESGGNRSQESGGNRNQDSGGNRNQESGGNRNQDTARRLPSKVDTEQDVAQRQPLRKPDIQKAPKAAKPVQIEPPTKTESVKSEDGGKVASIKDVTPRKPIVPDSYLMEKLPLGSTFLASVEATTADCASHQPGYVCLTLHEDYSEVYAQLCDDFTAHCERDKDEYIPRIGETFAYYHAEDGAWYRARCLTRTRAALIDSPRVLSLSNNGRRLPASYTGVPEFATVLRTGSLQVGSNLRCTLVEKTANGFLVNLEDSETGLVVGQAEAMRWIPEVEYPAQDPTPAKLTPVQPTPVQPTPVQSTSAQPTPVQPAPVRASAAAEMPRPPILHNTNYVLLDVTSLGRACVRPCDPKSTAEFDSAIHDTVLYGIDAVPLEQPPSKGQSVVARFSDGTHYRAFVKRTNVAKNKYLIEYVEFGNEETVPIERLYPCPAALQLSAKPAQASLVALSHRKPPELTSRATEYIDVLKDNAQQLILTIPGGAKQAASGSLVILLNAQNCEPVSRKIEELCTPEWKKLEERGGDVLEMECRMFSDLKYIPLPQSRPFTLAVTYCEPSSLASGVLNGYEKGADMARCVYTELSDQIQEYCASPLCREPYLPKLEELCITKHYRLDKWVRSVFIKLSGSAGSKVAQVCAIDYGDIMEVPVYEIRKMMPEFIDEYPALANHCDIKGFPENPSKVQLERVIGVLNLSPNGVGEVKVDSCQDEGDNMYEITASELMAALAV